jgi:hypothetical protein
MSLNSATHLLQDYHKRLIGLFRQYEAVRQRTPEMVDGVTREILMEIEILMVVEEQLFYPALLSHLSPTESLPVDSGIIEHQNFKERISTLPKADSYREEFEDLIQTVEASMDREIIETFPLARHLSLKEQSDLVEGMKEFREDLLAQPQYRDSLPSAVEDPRYDYKNNTSREQGPILGATLD